MKRKVKKMALTTVFAFFALTPFKAQTAFGATYKVDIDRPGGIYRCGETATFSVRLLSTKHLAAAKASYVTLDDFGTTVFTNMPFDVTATGVVFTASGTLQKPGFLRLVLPKTDNARAAFYVPAITDTMGYLKGRQSGWPQVVENNSSTPARRAVAEKWAPYFDGANFASRITCPVRIAVGFSDTTCPPCAVYAAYNEIKVKDKAIGNGIGMTHSCRRQFYSQFGNWVKNTGH